jgi:hypothetical protein
MAREEDDDSYLPLIEVDVPMQPVHPPPEEEKQSV